MAAPMMQLADLCDLISDQVDPSACAEEVYVGLEHLEAGRFKRKRQGTASEVQSTKFAFQSGDVLYGKLRPYLDKAVLVDEAGICSTELLVLRHKENVDPRFLAGLVHAPSFAAHAVSGTTGVQHPRTSWSHIRKFELPCFDSSEQTQIANFLWQVHDAVTLNEDGAELGLHLKHTAMQRLFTQGFRGEAQKETEAGTVPESWSVEPLKEHHSVASGGTPSRGNPAFWEGGTIPWVKTAEVNYCRIVETEEHVTEAALNWSAAKLLPSGTVLLAMYGQGKTRAKVAILGIEAACNQACAAIRCIDNAVEPRFLYHFLSYRYEDIRQLAHGGQQQNLNLEIVRNLPIAFPSEKSEQREISAILDAIDRKIDSHRHKRTVLEELFKALLHKLMTGEIRVADLDLSPLGTKTLGDAAA